MLNQAAVDALCSAAYLENYLDCVDDLPNDLQRTVTMLRELDCVTNGMYILYLIFGSLLTAGAIRHRMDSSTC